MLRFRFALIPALLLTLLAQGCHKRAAKMRLPQLPPPIPAAEAPPPPPPPPPPTPEPRPSEIPPPIPPPAPPMRVIPAPVITIAEKKKPKPIPKPAQPPAPVEVTDVARPRKIVLKPTLGLSPTTGAYYFETHPLSQNKQSIFRLLIDPAPILTASAEDYARKRVPGTTDGSPLEISPSFEAHLVTSDPTLHIAAEDPAVRAIAPHRSVEWFWDVTPTSSGKASLRLDLTAASKPVDPFPIHAEIPIAPIASPLTPAPPPARPSSAPSRWPWLALLPIALAVLWWLLRRKKTPHPTATQTALPRTIVQQDGAYSLVVDVLVISHSTDRAPLQELCRQLTDTRCNFILPIPGFPIGSPRWQQWLESSLESADAILVALTADSLGARWLNWQLEKARAAQASRGIPIFVAALDSQVLKVARSVQLLEGMACYPPTPQGQAELKDSLLGAEPASTRRLRCFISYSHRYSPFATRLCQDLNRAGIRTWMDVDGIPGGAAWKNKIAEAIDSSTHVLFLLTEESVKSEQVAAEIDWARQQKKIVVPVMEVDVKLPFGLVGTQYISFTEGYDAGFRRLIQDLARTGVLRGGV